MKKLIIATVLFLIAGSVFSQNFQKGNLLGVHHITVTLDPDVSMNQFLDAINTLWIPAIEKLWSGSKLYIIKGIRGEQENGYGILYQFETEADRDKYFKEDGTLTDEGNANVEKMTPVNEKMDKLGNWSSAYTDWLIL